MDSAAIRAGRAFVEIFTDDANFKKTLDRSARTFRAWGQSLTAAGAKLMGGGTALLAPLLGATKAYASMGAELARASEKTGVSVEVLSAQKYAAEQAGVAFEELQTGYKRMSRTLFEAAQGNKGAQKSFEELGLSVGDLARMSPDQQFRAIAEGISKVESPTAKAALAMKIFGRSGADLLPLLDQGAAGIDAMVNHAKELGLVISTTDAKAAEELTHRLSDLWDVIKIGVFTIGGALAPVVRSVAIAITHGVVSLKQFIEQHRGLVIVVAGVAAAMIAGGVVLVVFGQLMIYAGAAIGGVIAGLGVLTTVVAAIFSPLAAMVAVIAAGTVALLKFSNVGQAVGSYLSEVFNTLKTDATNAFGGIRNGLVAGDWSLAAKILWAFLKLEWAKGSASILSTWAELKTALLDTWANLSAGIATAWSYVVEYLSSWDGVKAAAQKFLSWMGGAFQNTVNHVADLLQDLFMTTGAKQLKTELAKIDADEAAGKYKNGPNTAEKAREAARNTYGDYDDKARAQRDAQRQSDYAARQKAIDDEFARKQPGAAAGAEATRAKIEAERQAQLEKNRLDLQKRLAAAEASGSKEVADLKAQLAAFNAKAADEAKNNTPTFKGPKPFDADAAEAGLFAMAKNSTAGTFLGSAAWGLGGQGNDPVARNTQKANEILEKIQADIGGMARRGGGIRVG